MTRVGILATYLTLADFREVLTSAEMVDVLSRMPRRDVLYLMADLNHRADPKVSDLLARTHWYPGIFEVAFEVLFKPLPILQPQKRLVDPCEVMKAKPGFEFRELWASESEIGFVSIIAIDDDHRRVTVDLAYMPHNEEVPEREELKHARRHLEVQLEQYKRFVEARFRALGRTS